MHGLGHESHQVQNVQQWKWMQQGRMANGNE
jgi:hypothetical protein